MNAMGAERFVVTIVDTKKGQQEIRQWYKDEVIKSMAWLGRMNARGCDILIRPDGEHGLILMDGLSKLELKTLRERGFAPAAVVETGREQYQAWLKLSAAPLPAPLRSQAATGLVHYLGRSGVHRLGRIDGLLAGFTNQQVNSADGRHPFVLLAESAGKPALAAPAYLAYLPQARERSRMTPRDTSRDRSRGPTR